MDFLFHKVSESEKKEIQKQAKKIMDDFAGQLNKVKEQVREDFVERGDGQRAPSHGDDPEGPQAYNRKGCENLLRGPEPSRSVGTFPREMFTKGKESKIKCNKISRGIMFENAPKKNGDFIVGEEKKW